MDCRLSYLFIFSNMAHKYIRFGKQSRVSQITLKRGSLIDSCSRASSVISLAQTSVYQLRDTDIRVNAICPGLIETGMTSFTFDAARVRGTAGKIGHLNPLGRYGVSEGEKCAKTFSCHIDP